MHEAESPIVLPCHFLGFDNWINPLTLSWVAFLLVMLFLWAAGRNLQKVPSGLQNLAEMGIESIQSLSEPLVGKHAPFFLPLFFTLFFFILVSNLLGLVPGSVSPTSRLDIILGMSLTVIFATHYFGIREKGLGRHLAHLFLPPPIPVDPKASLGLKIMLRFVQGLLLLMMPAVHLIGEIVKPISLTLRLFGNMMAKEKILAVLILLMMVFGGGIGLGKAAAVFPFLLRICIVLLGVFVSVLQAFVFMLLAMVYIGGAVNPTGHGEDEEKEVSVPSVQI